MQGFSNGLDGKQLPSQHGFLQDKLNHLEIVLIHLCLTCDVALFQALPCHEVSFLLLPAQMITFGKEGVLGLRGFVFVFLFSGGQYLTGMCNTID